MSVVHAGGQLVSLVALRPRETAALELKRPLAERVQIARFAEVLLELHGRPEVAHDSRILA